MAKWFTELIVNLTENISEIYASVIIIIIIITKLKQRKAILFKWSIPKYTLYMWDWQKIDFLLDKWKRKPITLAKFTYLPDQQRLEDACASHVLM